MRGLLGWLVAALICVPASAQARADWHVAESKHFIIYANEDPKRLLEFATRLEKFDKAARTISAMPDPEVGDGNRLTVFVMPNANEVRELVGDRNKFLEGFYTGRASGSLAYVSKPKSASDDFAGEAVFFHEYAHHLMMQQFDHAYPEWYVEGYAEFLSTPKFDRDGSVGLGAPPEHRAWGLFHGRSLPLDALLGNTYGDITRLSTDERESIYGRGWLLVHYLFMEPKRRGQVANYIRQITEGTAPAQAAASAFGDLKQLQKELQIYLKRPRIMSLQIPAALLSTGPVNVKRLSPGGAQVILPRAKLKMRDDKEAAEPIAAQIRAVQGRFPGDELVELSLAEAELKTERYAAAEAAADRALKANPRNTQAIILKGKAVLEQAALADGDASSQFAEARKMFIAANKIDSEDPEPLLEFYKSFLREGQRPNDNAMEALHYAARLAPQDLGTRMNSAIAYLNAGKAAEARQMLVPVAYSPHEGGVAAVARQIIERIDAGDVKGALATAR